MLSGIPTSPTASLLFICRNYFAPGTKKGFRVHLEMMDQVGNIKAFQQDMSFNYYDGTVETFFFPLYKGVLLSVHAEIMCMPQGNTKLWAQGDTWVSIFLSSEKQIPNIGGNFYEWGKKGSLLSQGYLYYMNPLSWTMGKGRVDGDSMAGTGKIIHYNEASVPWDIHGSSYQITPPLGQVWFVEDVCLMLTTSATVATRRFLGFITNNAISPCEFESQQTQGNGLSKIYFFSIDSLAYAGSDVHDPLPKRILTYNDILTFSLTSVQVGDSLTGISYRYRRLINY